jgi:DNA processing protein
LPTQDPGFWQLLIAAEATPRKSRDLIAELGSSLFGFEAGFLNHASLSPSERKRVAMSEPKALENALLQGASILVEEAYPDLLKQSADFVSPALFVHGDTSCLYRPTVGIVGTRNATPYGKACAQKFAEALASAGVTIVSGGALGIDAAAHRGALAVDGSTVAVFAGGIDWVYPASHAELFRQIRRKGCLMSQFAAGFRPSDYKFLARNVTVAALSQLLLVIQAPVRSGSLSTANAAVEMGREVFVVPANIDAVEFRGSFNLIRDGASLCYHPDQILEALGLKGAGSKEDRNPGASDLGDIAQKIVSLLSLEPVDTEKLAEKTGLSSGEILSELTMLELDGVVRRESGGYILRK